MLLLFIDVLAAILLGSMLFFALVVAPPVFRLLEPEQAGVFLRAVFERYFIWGIVISAITLVACLIHSPKGSVLMALVLAGFIYLRQVLMPRINQAREIWQETDSPSDKARFKSLHRRSVLINSAQMVLLVIMVVAFFVK